MYSRCHANVVKSKIWKITFCAPSHQDTTTTKINNLKSAKDAKDTGLSIKIKILSLWPGMVDICLIMSENWRSLGGAKLFQPSHVIKIAYVKAYMCMKNVNADQKMSTNKCRPKIVVGSFCGWNIYFYNSGVLVWKCKNAKVRRQSFRRWSSLKPKHMTSTHAKTWWLMRPGQMSNAQMWWQMLKTDLRSA